MSPTVHIDLSRVRENAVEIARKTGVPVIAVIKANAYGLGARAVVVALRDVVEGFYCFAPHEAVEAETAATGKSTICLVNKDGETADEYRAHRIRPAVWDVRRAAALRSSRPVLAVDTGMQRFACPAERIDEVLAAGACDEAFTHAVKPERVRRLAELCAGRGLRLHAAGSALLDVAEARLDAVRPGLALYRDAVRVSTRLADARDSAGPTGYSGFVPATRRHGVFIGGYAIGLRPGPCLVNGQPRRILECGMQSSFVEIGPNDRTGDEVVLVGDSITVEQVAADWKTSPQEALLRLASCGHREYRD